MFHAARTKLTAWYLLIIMVVSLIFSMVIYKMLIDEVISFERTQRFRIERRLEDSQFSGPLFSEPRTYVGTLPVNTELIDQVRSRLILTLCIINGIILIVAGGMAYFLAGRTLKPIQVMMEEQNRFISDASHELKTPLTSLKIAFEVYLRTKKRTVHEADLLVQDSIADVEKLQSLSQSLLTLAQYQKPTLPEDFITISVEDTLKEAVKRIEPLAKQKNIAFKLSVSPIQIEAIKEEFISLFVILFDNAVKYSKEDSVVSVFSKQHDHTVSIKVSDTGIGIAAKDIPHVFDRFYRADAARTKDGVGGYGLGLPIAKKITDIHHGTIQLTSKVLKGTTFTIHLPIKQSRYNRTNFRKLSVRKDSIS